MLGKQERQTSFLDIESWMGHSIVAPDSIYGMLKTWGDSLVQDAEFEALYSHTGRPSVSPALLSKVLLLMYHDNVTDREAEERAKYDLRWKTALGLGLDEAGFDHRALSRFRTRILVNQQQKMVFERFIYLAKAAGIVKDDSLQIIDSTHILGAGAIKDTYALIKGSIQKMLAVSSRKNSLVSHKLKDLKFEIDYNKKEKEDIDWNDPACRIHHLNQLVKDSRSILQAIEKMELSAEEKAAAEILETITEQDIE